MLVVPELVKAPRNIFVSPFALAWVILTLPFGPISVVPYINIFPPPPNCTLRVPLAITSLAKRLFASTSPPTCILSALSTATVTMSPTNLALLLRAPVIVIFEFAFTVRFFINAELTAASLPS
ncbi:hypothetical protein Sarmat_00439 [Rickettsiales endosymbiont of Paramecium tredecaurelia]|nr:hypothetical protein [Candidatus Sarmatiella mevalonica]